MIHHGFFQLACVNCSAELHFSLFDLEHGKDMVLCSQCGKRYSFADETLKRQLLKFAALCRQIRESEEILSSAAIAVDVDEHTVKIPFKLLLSRLKSTLDIQIGDERLILSFRIEPTALQIR